ncbi:MULTISPECIES: hypothetical protein [Okeania]|uniref:hypothetical protein n=1 Tax=Okeania TaxID=1458928 RepID=UPI001374C408|nr:MULTISPECIES: hypothetical protein [Okeania]NES78262.1 hypothetical protein [Okeania sp. SIO1H4]NET16642.1 hypothetical protein [Okeania sp. SIO1H6]NET21562.1 hypothetical protein [Okeania sp. SIO1H5]NET94950.1 hypothetical protein [Okeania sp. SIO1H2]
MTIADVAIEVEVTPPTPSASDNEMTIAAFATVVELIIESQTIQIFSYFTKQELANQL